MLWLNLYAILSDKQFFIGKIDHKNIWVILEWDVQRLLINQLQLDLTCAVVFYRPVHGHVLRLLCQSWLNLNSESRQPYVWLLLVLQLLQIDLWWDFLECSCEQDDNFPRQRRLGDVRYWIGVRILVAVHRVSDQISKPLIFLIRLIPWLLYDHLLNDRHWLGFLFNDWFFLFFFLYWGRRWLPGIQHGQNFDLELRQGLSYSGRVIHKLSDQDKSVGAVLGIGRRVDLNLKRTVTCCVLYTCKSWVRLEKRVS